MTTSSDLPIDRPESGEGERSPRGLASSPALVLVGAGVLVVLLFLANLIWGSVDLGLAQVVEALLGRSQDEATATIVRELRLPRALAAAVVGAALAMSGLQMQTLFRNPLADPFILGVSSGASLGVAIVVLLGGASSELFGVRGVALGIGLVGAAALGALAVSIFMLLVASRVRDAVVVLVLGVILSAMIAALVTTLVFFADRERTRAFVEWGFGSFSRVTWSELWILGPVVGLGALLAWFSIRDLDALLLGESYARSLGVRVHRARFKILAGASVLAAATVAFAGPIGFLGIAVPHLARAFMPEPTHRGLLLSTALLGAAFGLGCGLLAQLPGSAMAFPLNAATALLCGPVVFWKLLDLRRGWSS